MNIDFANHPGFSAYVLLLMLSGVAMVLLGSPMVHNQRPLSRVLNLVFGIGFFVYGFYLAFLFDGGHYVIFFKAFILPVVLIVRSLGAARRRPVTAPAMPAPQWNAAPGTPTQWGAPPAPWGTPAAPPAQWGGPPAPSAQWGGPPAPSAQWGGPPAPSAHGAPAPTWPAPTQPAVEQGASPAWPSEGEPRHP